MWNFCPFFWQKPHRILQVWQTDEPLLRVQNVSLFRDFCSCHVATCPATAGLHVTAFVIGPPHELPVMWHGMSILVGAQLTEDECMSLQATSCDNLCLSVLCICLTVHGSAM